MQHQCYGCGCEEQPRFTNGLPRTWTQNPPIGELCQMCATRYARRKQPTLPNFSKMSGLKEVRKILAMAGFIFDGEKYQHTRDLARIVGYLQSDELLTQKRIPRHLRVGDASLRTGQEEQNKVAVRRKQARACYACCSTTALKYRRNPPIGELCNECFDSIISNRRHCFACNTAESKREWEWTENPPIGWLCGGCYRWIIELPAKQEQHEEKEMILIATQW